MIVKCSQIINPCGPRICHGIAQLSRTTSWTGCTTLQFFSHSTSALDVPDVSVRLSEAANHTVPLCFQNLWLNFHKNQLDIYSNNSCKTWVAHSSSGGSQALPQSVSECGPCPPSRKPQPGKIKKMHSNACSCSIKMRLDHVLYILYL